MDKRILKINDFQLLLETIQNMVKVSGNLKISVNNDGFESWLADDNEIVRLDVFSNSMSLCQDSDEPVVICTKNLQTISQLLLKIQKAHTAKMKRGVVPDYSDVEISVDDTTIYIKSYTLKTSVFLDNESAVHVLNPFRHELHTIAEVKSSIDDLKEVISSTFIFKQPDKITIEICHQDDMVRNIAYAFMSDPNDPRTNDIVTKFGNITSGDFTRKILIDVSKMKYLSMFPVEYMDIKFNQEPCFCSEFKQTSCDGSFSTNYRLISKYVLPRRTLSEEE